MSPLSLRHFADGERSGSLSNKMRNRRFQFFESLIADVDRPLRILDVGGTTAFWEQRGWADREDVRIVTLNHASESQRFEHITPVVGDALDLSRFGDDSFDVVFSNSVIEHVFTRENQITMANEIRRVGKAYWVQTPNFWFPIEPHFHVPGWQWMPREWRIGLLRRFRCGWRGPCPNVMTATKSVDEVRLLSKRGVRRLFPDATIRPERFGGMVKSWVMHYGFEQLRSAGDSNASNRDTLPFPVQHSQSTSGRRAA